MEYYRMSYDQRNAFDRFTSPLIEELEELGSVYDLATYVENVATYDADTKAYTVTASTERVAEVRSILDEQARWDMKMTVSSWDAPSDY